VDHLDALEFHGSDSHTIRNVDASKPILLLVSLQHVGQTVDLERSPVSQVTGRLRAEKVVQPISSWPSNWIAAGGPCGGAFKGAPPR
jgi:hypothetical protein